MKMNLQRCTAGWISLTIIIGITLLHFLPSPARADETAINPFDASKFAPLPIPEKFPPYIVMDQRTSEQIFIKMKRKMMPPKEYVRNGIQQVINVANSEIIDSMPTLQFIINDFHVELQRKTSVAVRDTGEITSRIEIELSLVNNGVPQKIENYSAISFKEIENLRYGVPSADIQYVLDQNLYNIFKKIFADKSFLDSIGRAP